MQEETHDYRMTAEVYVDIMIKLNKILIHELYQFYLDKNIKIMDGSDVIDDCIIILGELYKMTIEQILSTNINTIHKETFRKAIYRKFSKYFKSILK